MPSIDAIPVSTFQRTSSSGAYLITTTAKSTTTSLDYMILHMRSLRWPNYFRQRRQQSQPYILTRLWETLLLLCPLLLPLLPLPFLLLLDSCFCRQQRRTPTPQFRRIIYLPTLQKASQKASQRHQNHRSCHRWIPNCKHPSSRALRQINILAMQFMQSCFQI